MSLTDKEPGIQWVQLLPNLAVGEVEEAHMAGLIGCRISIHDMADGPYDWNKGVWGKKMKRRPMNIKARAYIYQCRDLPAADDTGSSDPFVVIHDSDRE